MSPSQDMFTPGEDENEDAEIRQPGPEVSRGLFLEWRDARRGETPGQTMSNPVWLWLIDSNISAYRGNKHFDGPSSYNGNPGWCFNRFGRTLTELPGGTQILIAGEHEDHYDPDFFIYNDVVSEETHWIQLTVEGELPTELMDAYVNQVTQRLA